MSSEGVLEEATLVKQNERLKRKLDRARSRLNKAESKIESLEKEKSEIIEELKALKAVVKVYDDHRPQANELKAVYDSDSEEEFEEDIESFDKTNTRDDTDLPRPSRSKSPIDRVLDAPNTTLHKATSLEMRSPNHPLIQSDSTSRPSRSHQRNPSNPTTLKQSSSSSSTTTSTSSTATRDVSSPSKSRSSDPNSKRKGSAPSEAVQSSTKDDETVLNDSKKRSPANSASSPNVKDLNIPKTGTESRPAGSKRRDVPLSSTALAASQRKYHTTRENRGTSGVGVISPDNSRAHIGTPIGINLSKADERELYGDHTKVTSPITRNTMEARTPREASDSAIDKRTTIASISSKQNDQRAASSLSNKSSSNPALASSNEPQTHVDDDANNRDQPKIFDENTVRDILCGLGITCSRQFNDDLLVPEDYSYSYQFKVRRVPHQLLKFKDFAPKVFQQIRSHWGVNNADLLLSFRYENLDAIRGDGKSGAFFIFTKDKRYILKTATGPERDFLWEMLPYYFLYIRKNPNTLLPRFYGVYSMKHEGIGGVVRFVVMNNWFNTPSPLSEVYDLKGSTLGRSSGEDVKPGSIMKDLDITRLKRKLYLDDEAKQLFLDQLRSDSEFLADRNVMDYSLLVGIYHDTEEGKQATLKKQIQRSKLYSEDTSMKSLWQIDDNGIAGWNPVENRREVYFCGIIDILQKYNSKKKIEHLLKSIPYKAETISIVEPSYYSKRFHNFLAAIIATSPISVSASKQLLVGEEVIEEEIGESSDTEVKSSSKKSKSVPEPGSSSKPKKRKKKSANGANDYLSDSSEDVSLALEAPKKLPSPELIKPKKKKKSESGSASPAPESQDVEPLVSKEGKTSKK